MQRNILTMKEFATRMIPPYFAIKHFNQSTRLAIGTLLLSSLVACASVPPTSVEPDANVNPASDQGLASASVMYNTRDYAGAVAEFDRIIANDATSSNSRRLAHLGKALIYLGSDESWHSLDKAKMALNSAGSVMPESDEEFAIETDMFMDSIAAQIGSESQYLELKEKSGGSSAEIARLKKERDALAQERDALLKEQQTLNEALEKLKNLTLGS